MASGAAVWMAPEQINTVPGQEIDLQEDTKEAAGPLTLVKQYLWKHPGRSGRISLFASPDGNKVTFTHLAEGKPIADCPPHGNWEFEGNLLKISFHHEAKQYWRTHLFMKHNPAQDVWYMTGLFEGEKAKDFAYLQPWYEQ